MSSDASIKQVEALYAFRADINNASSAICSSLSLLSQEVWAEQSKYDSLLDSLQTKVNYCEEELARAESEYEHYVSNTDEEDYDAYYASCLRSEISQARDRLREANDNLSQGRMIVQEARDILMQISNLSASAASSISSETDRVTGAVDKAAYSAGKYMED